MLFKHKVVLRMLYPLKKGHYLPNNHLDITRGSGLGEIVWAARSWSDCDMSDKRFRFFSSFFFFILFWTSSKTRCFFSVFSCYCYSFLSIYFFPFLLSKRSRTNSKPVAVAALRPSPHAVASTSPCFQQRAQLCVSLCVCCLKKTQNADSVRLQPLVAALPVEFGAEVQC